MARWRKTSGTCFGATLMDCWPVAGKALQNEVRRGHLVQFGIYLLSMAMMPASLKKYPREQVELRSGARWDELPLLAAAIVNVLPSYLHEMRRLLE